MTQGEREALAREIARELHNMCPLGMTQELVTTLREIAEAWRTGKRTFWRMFCGFAVLGGVVMALAGVTLRFKGIIVKVLRVVGPGE